MTRLVLLGDLMAEKGYIRGPFGSALRRPEMKSEGVPVYEQQNAIYNHRDFRFFIDDQKYEELKRFTVKPGDLLISCSGTLGRITIIRPDDPIGIISQALLILRVDQEKVLPEYLYYFLTSTQGQYLLLGASHGSVQTNIAKRAVVEAIKIELPSLSEQQEIVNILGTIDEKIELNRKMNETLEQMGQALFRHYFIDNPEAEKWEDGKFSDVADVLTGKGSTKSQLSEAGVIPLYGANGVMGTSEDYLYNEPLVITGRVGTLGKVRAVTGKAWFSDNVLIMKPKVASFGFIYHLAQTFDYISMNRGSTQPLVTQTDLKNRKIRIPDAQTLEKFEQQFSNLFEQQQNNDEQIQTLTTLRDTLLPRLINGKVKL